MKKFNESIHVENERQMFEAQNKFNQEKHDLLI